MGASLVRDISSSMGGLPVLRVEGSAVSVRTCHQRQGEAVEFRVSQTFVVVIAIMRIAWSSTSSLMRLRLQQDKAQEYTQKEACKLLGGLKWLPHAVQAFVALLNTCRQVSSCRGSDCCR